MKMRAIAAAMVMSAVASPTWALDDLSLDKLTAKGQATFEALTEDLAAALSYKAIVPAEPLGMPGFDVGLELSLTKLQNTDKWGEAIGDTSLSILPLPKLHAHVGLPFGVDFGAVYASVPSTNIKYYGGELRYSFVSGNTLIPAVAVRGAMTKLTGVDHFDLSTKSLELTVSKGFLMLTPYAGIGNVWATGSSDVKKSSGATAFSDADLSLFKAFLGLNINMGLVNFAFEADKTGDAPTYSAKFGLRF